MVNECDIERIIQDKIDGNITGLKKGLSACNTKQILKAVNEYIQITGDRCQRALLDFERLTPGEY